MAIKKFIYEKREDGFVANALIEEFDIYITIASHYEQYVNVDPIRKNSDGTISAVSFMDDLIMEGVAREVSKEFFSELLKKEIEKGVKIYNNAGEQFEKYKNHL